jgi:hypothetical protein
VQCAVSLFAGSAIHTENHDSRIQDHLPNLSDIVVATAISLFVGSVATHMVLEERSVIQRKLEWKIAWLRNHCFKRFVRKLECKKELRIHAITA